MRVLQSQHTQSHPCKPWLGFYTGSVFVFLQYLTTVPREQLFTKQKGKSRIQWVPFSQLGSSIHKGADIRRGVVSFLPASQFKLVSCSMFWSHSLLLPYPPNSASSLLSLVHHVQFVLLLTSQVCDLPLEHGQPTRKLILTEIWFSLPLHPLVSSISPAGCETVLLSPPHAGIFSDGLLHRSYGYCCSHCGFVFAAVSLCPENTVSL